MMASNRKSAAEIAFTRLPQSYTGAAELRCIASGPLAVKMCFASDMPLSNQAICYNKTYELAVNVTKDVRKKFGICYFSRVTQGNLTDHLQKVSAG